jgi:hypothetical protein
VIERGELIRHVSAALDWEEPKTEMALELFISGPREEFLKPVLPHRREDVYPWRFNRSMSYLRKPLILRAAAAGDVVVFGIRNVYLAGAYLTDLCIGGRLKARTDTMKRHISDTQATAAEKFNDEVAALFDKRDGLIVRVRIDKFGSQRLEEALGRPLGDVDVLVADPLRLRRRLLAIEVKDLAGARTPTEMANELATTFVTRGKRLSAVEKHLKRVVWLRSNRSAVLSAMGLDGRSADRWRVEPLLIVDRELFAPRLAHVAVPVLSYREVSMGLASGKLLTRST